MSERVNKIIKSDSFSEISRDIGQVFFAGVVVQPIISQTATLNILVVGVILSMSFWSISINNIK